MSRIAAVIARTDAFCARLNHGLMAVALVLTILTGALSLVRSAQWIEPVDGEWPEATLQ
jgi:cytochrome b subunit of formate dehydrogenase